MARSRRGKSEPPAVRQPAGFHTVTPRVVVEDPAGFIKFIKRVFGGEGELQKARPSQIRIGDSILMVTGTGARETFPAFLYVYVADADAACRRATDAGATVLEEVRDTPYGDRRGMVKDRWGNVWQIATPARRTGSAHRRSPGSDEAAS
jgi:PhnB protein